MNKISAFLGRASLIGDTVAFLPVLTYFKKINPNSHIIFPISRKTSQSAPLFINQKDIDRIHILQEQESLGPEDIKLAKSCEAFINPFPSHPEGNNVGVSNFWYNKYSLFEETVRMASIDPNHFNSILTEDEKKPQLEQWFDIKPIKNTIAVWCMAGYGTQPKRSPTKQWWNNTVDYLLQGYNVIRLGHPAEPNLSQEMEDEGFGYEDKRHLSFFEQIKLSLSVDISIATNSGSSICLGAYGAKQITLLTDDAPGHVANFEAFGPLNHKNNNINLFSKNGFDNLKYTDIIEAINKLK